MDRIGWNNFPYICTIRKTSNLKHDNMGIINQGILGGFSGKVGPIVGFHWKSNYYIRSRAAKISNPRTPKQQEQRGKFATAFSFLKTIKPFIRIGYKDFTQDKSAFNAAMSYTLKRAVTGSGKDIMIDFNRVLVSMGTLMPAFEGTATRNGGKMSFNWHNNSGMGNAENTDIAMLLVYNKDKETAIYDTEAALRSDSNGEMTLPNDWQDDELVAYLSFCSADGSCTANSVRLPVTTVQTAPHVPHSEDSALWALSSEQTVRNWVISGDTFAQTHRWTDKECCSIGSFLRYADCKGIFPVLKWQV